MRRALAVLGMLAPAIALACPVCAADRNPHALLLVGAMIAARIAWITAAATT